MTNIKERNMYYPLAGMNYILEDLSQIVSHRELQTKDEIVLYLSAQVNCYPHIGTVTNFSSAFALGNKLQSVTGKKVRINVELLESVTGEKFEIENNIYYKNLENVSQDDGFTIKETYLPYFEDILERLKAKTGIEYEISFFYDYQKQELVRKALLEVMNHYEELALLLSPKDGKIKLRFPCSKCGLTDKSLEKTRIEYCSEEKLVLSTVCPIHGKQTITITPTNDSKFDMNVPLRYLVKAIYLINRDKKYNSLSVIVDGGDWSGMWPLRIYTETLMKLKYDSIPSIIYTPTILDWAGSKLSKRMYVGGDNAYREFLTEGLINYSEFYNEYGDDAFDRYFEHVSGWIEEPKKFIRDYTIEYVDSILRVSERVSI